MNEYKAGQIVSFMHNGNEVRFILISRNNTAFDWKATQVMGPTYGSKVVALLPGRNVKIIKEPPVSRWQLIMKDISCDGKLEI
jgi:hypothetical protein